MRPITIEYQPVDAAPVDKATKADIEEALEEARLHGTVSPEQSRINARQRYEAWRKAQEKAHPPN